MTAATRRAVDPDRPLRGRRFNWEEFERVYGQRRKPANDNLKREKAPLWGALPLEQPTNQQPNRGEIDPKINAKSVRLRRLAGLENNDRVHTLSLPELCVALVEPPCTPDQCWGISDLETALEASPSTRLSAVE